MMDDFKESVSQCETSFFESQLCNQLIIKLDQYLISINYLVCFVVLYSVKVKLVYSEKLDGAAAKLARRHRTYSLSFNHKGQKERKEKDVRSGKRRTEWKWRSKQRRRLDLGLEPRQEQDGRKES